MRFCNGNSEVDTRSYHIQNLP